LSDIRCWKGTYTSQSQGSTVPATFGWPMAAFSSWMELIHSPPDLTTSLLLYTQVKRHTATTQVAQSPHTLCGTWFYHVITHVCFEGCKATQQSHNILTHSLLQTIFTWQPPSHLTPPPYPPNTHHSRHNSTLNTPQMQRQTYPAFVACC
jgi:hypothetical protein